MCKFGTEQKVRTKKFRNEFGNPFSGGYRCPMSRLVFQLAKDRSTDNRRVYGKAFAVPNTAAVEVAF